ncbi:unnamed protein product [Cuscuta campestris]|uniref:EamA domain-containing protein n=1 Tax=Cuscuta campestris TaxID=132261 RepID=A0A484LZ02_9ASTE|nr:unnamed protein product [Cuscuta campestris]
MEAEKIWGAMQGLKPAFLMVVVQAVFAGVNVLYKIAASDGMNLSVLVCYRFLFATGFIVPVALLAERNKRPKLTWTIVLLAFLCGLFGGSLGQNLYLQSLVYTSATYATAIFNLIPGITFIVAVTFRLERLGWKTASGKAKVLGTVFGIGGAMLLTFYKGPELNLWKTNIHLLHSSPHNSNVQSKPLLGTLLALIGCVCYSCWLILQAKAAERFPCPYSFTALTMVFGSVQAFIYAICRERDLREWKLGWNIRLLAAAYAGIMGSGLMFTVIAWAVRMKGPVYVSVFNPLMLVMVALAGSLCLDERLHLGTLLGAGLIITGLYIVLWGKGREIKRVSQLVAAAGSETTEGKVGQVEIDITPTPSSRKDGSCHVSSRKSSMDMRRDNCSLEGGGGGEEEGILAEGGRPSLTGSEVLGGFYLMRRQSLKAAVLMVAVEAVLTGVNVMLKLAASDGMSLSVLVFYRFFFAAFFISPVAFLLERVEELGLKTAAGRAKVLGTILCIGGAMLLTFYHGPKFTLWKPPIHLLRRHTPPPHAAAAAQSSNPLLGCVLAVLAVLLYSFMLILQGILGGGVVYGVSTWCVHARGPVYVAAFTPLWLLMMALAAFLFLDENIYLGTDGAVNSNTDTANTIRKHTRKCWKEESYSGLGVHFRSSIEEENHHKSTSISKGLKIHNSQLGEKSLTLGPSKAQRAHPLPLNQGQPPPPLEYLLREDEVAQSPIAHTRRRFFRPRRPSHGRSHPQSLQLQKRSADLQNPWNFTHPIVSFKFGALVESNLMKVLERRNKDEREEENPRSKRFVEDDDVKGVA